MFVTHVISELDALWVLFSEPVEDVALGVEDGFVGESSADGVSG